MDSDTQTLELLERILSPPGPDLRPTAGELHAFERAVRLAFAAPTESRWPGGRNRTAIAVFGALALATASSVLALQSGAELPRPVRAVVFAAGVPVDSPALADARHALGALEAATLAGDDLGRIANAAAGLRERLTHLDGGERSQIEERAAAALQNADRLLSPAANEPAPFATGIEPPTSVPSSGSGSGDRPAVPDGIEPPSGSTPDDDASSDDPSPNGSSGPSDSSGPGSDESDETDKVLSGSSNSGTRAADIERESGSSSEPDTDDA